MKKCYIVKYGDSHRELSTAAICSDMESALKRVEEVKAFLDRGRKDKLEWNAEDRGGCKYSTTSTFSIWKRVITVVEWEMDYRY